jgi:hypothetical protein
MQFATSAAVGNGLGATIKHLRGAAGVGVGTTINYLRHATMKRPTHHDKYLQRKASGAAGNGLGTTIK